MKAVCQDEEVIQSCMYNIVFRVMSIRCSKHVEDKKNLIKTLILKKCILLVYITQFTTMRGTIT